MSQHAPTDIFEAQRPFLLGLAYRILGSLAEAEDAVQDTWLKWCEAEPVRLSNPAAWLTTTCTRLCIDVLRSARRARVEYVGAWLPEPIHTLHDNTPEHALERASSLSMAFLLVLERLSPKERAAYLLREIFELAYSDVAAALGVQEAACRKLVSRARERVGAAASAGQTSSARQRVLLDAFQAAIMTGETHELATLMVEDIELQTDGGGKALALLDPIHGRADVLGFLGGTLHKFWQKYDWQWVELNGARGAVVRDGEQVVAAVSVGVDEHGRLCKIFIMRNPDKLERLAGAPRPVR